MTIMCATDGGDYYVSVQEVLSVSPGTEFCIECKKMIRKGTPHYRVYEYALDYDGEEVHLADLPCCEECGDLAVSFLELGFCWDYGSLRSDISEAHGEGML